MAHRVGSYDDFAQNIQGTIDVKEVGHVEKESKYFENIENEKIADGSDGPQVSLPRPWAGQGPWRGYEPGRGPTQSTVTVCDFWQVDGGPPGGSGEKELQPPAPCNHKQRLECILKRAALEEQVGADVSVGGRGGGTGGPGQATLQWAGSKSWCPAPCCSA